MQPVQYHFKSDYYTTSRGGTVGFLQLSCQACQQVVALYQKDLPDGPLLRVYCNRFLAPEDLIMQMQSYRTCEEMQALICPACAAILATPMLYEKENRLALLVQDGALDATYTNGLFPQPNV